MIQELTFALMPGLAVWASVLRRGVSALMILLSVGCTILPLRKAGPVSDLVEGVDVVDQLGYDLTARFISSTGRLYVGLTIPVVPEQPSSVESKDELGHSMILSGQLLQLGAEDFSLSDFHFAADSPAQGDSPRDVFGMRMQLDLKIGEVIAGGAFQGPRFEIVLRESCSSGQSGKGEQ